MRERVFDEAANDSAACEKTDVSKATFLVTESVVVRQRESTGKQLIRTGLQLSAPCSTEQTPYTRTIAHGPILSILSASVAQYLLTGL